MPKSTKTFVSKETLIDAALPAATSTYTVISHEFIINTVLQNLNDNGFNVLEEKYRCNMDGKVAQGIYKIEYANDPDLSMMFAWVNSYDKSLKFRCSVGGHVNASGASMMKRSKSWERKHTGTALQETEATIIDLVSNANTYFDELLQLKNLMKNIYIDKDSMIDAHTELNKLKEQYAVSSELTEEGKIPDEEELGMIDGDIQLVTTQINESARRYFGWLMGDLFFTKKILTGDQCSVIMRELDNPSFDYNCSDVSLWTMYNHILCGLRITHPRKWMESQTMVLLHLMDKYNLVVFDEEEVTEVTEATVEETNELLHGVDNTGGLEPEENMHATARTAEDIAADEEADDMKVDEIMEENLAENNAISAEYKPDAFRLKLLAEEEDVNTNKRVDISEPITEDETYSEQEAKAKEKRRRTKDLQNIPADNVVTVNEEDALIYVEAGDYPDGEIGQYIDVDNEIYELVSKTEVEGEIYFQAKKYKEPDFEVADAYEDMLDVNTTAKLPNAPVIKEAPEVVSGGSDFDIDLPVEEIPSPTIVDPIEEVVDVIETIDETLEEEIEERLKDKGPIWKIIAAEIEELYGISDDSFKYELKDDQYNVVLDSGEAMSLPCSYVDSLIQENN
jgi:hypothetical protein